MILLYALLAGVAGAGGGWGVCVLVDRRTPQRHPIERRLAVVVSALLLPALGAKFGFASPLLLVYGAFALVLVGVTLVDFRKYEIPHGVTIPGTISGIALGAFVLPSGFALSLMGAVFGGGVLILATLVEAARKKEVGGGDWKYAAMIGAFLGWPAIVRALILTGVLGVAAALVLRARGATPRPQALGPWLSGGALLALLAA